MQANLSACELDARLWLNRVEKSLDPARFWPSYGVTMKATMGIIEPDHLALPPVAALLEDDGDSDELAADRGEPSDDAARDPVWIEDAALDHALVAAAGRGLIIERVDRFQGSA
ncbi:MAG: hypothetical protein WAJ85_05550 [Candidatus Baltobacteraceae bacterium]